MSEPILIENLPQLNAVDMSISQTSPIIELGAVSGYAVQSVFSGAPVGTLYVSGGNTMNIPDFIPVDTYAVTAAGGRLLNVDKVNYCYVIVQWVPTSGTGTLTSTVSCKRN